MQNFKRTYSDVVPPHWIDRNGHMNTAYYLMAFDEACDSLFATAGLTGAQSSTSFVAGRVRMAHRREVLEGERIVIWSGFAAVEAASVAMVHRLTVDEGVRATCDIHSIPFCLSSRKTVTLTKAQMDTAAPFLVPGMKNPFIA